MTTACMIFGGLAFVGWVCEKVKIDPAWTDLTNRWSEPVKAAPKPVPEPRPRLIINPLEQTYDGDWLTTGSR